LFKKLASGPQEKTVVRGSDSFSPKMPPEIKDAELRTAVNVNGGGKQIMHWTYKDDNPKRGIFFDWDVKEQRYGVVIGYSIEGKSLTMDTIRFDAPLTYESGRTPLSILSEPNKEVEEWKKSHVWEGIMEFCRQEHLDLFTTIPLMEKAVAQTAGIPQDNGFKIKLRKPREI